MRSQDDLESLISSAVLPYTLIGGSEAHTARSVLVALAQNGYAITRSVSALYEPPAGTTEIGPELPGWPQTPAEYYALASQWLRSAIAQPGEPTLPRTAIAEALIQLGDRRSWDGTGWVPFEVGGLGD